MLIAAIVILLLHGSNTATLLWPYDETSHRIEQQVTDEVRRKQAVDVINQMKAVNKAFAKKREKSVDALAKLAANRESPAADFQQASEPLIAEDKAVAESLLDLRFQLKSVLTAKEWAKVFPPAQP
jgi:hypothetical protein